MGPRDCWKSLPLSLCKHFWFWNRNISGERDLWTGAQAYLTHLSLVSVNWVSIGSGNGLLPTNGDSLSTGRLGTNFREIWFETQNFSFMRRLLKMSFAKWRPFSPGDGELTEYSDFGTSRVNTFEADTNGGHFPDDKLRCIVLNKNVMIAIITPLTFFLMSN